MVNITSNTSSLYISTSSEYWCLTKENRKKEQPQSPRILSQTELATSPFYRQIFFHWAWKSRRLKSYKNCYIDENQQRTFVVLLNNFSMSGGWYLNLYDSEIKLVAFLLNRSCCNVKHGARAISVTYLQPTYIRWNDVCTLPACQAIFWLVLEGMLARAHLSESLTKNKFVWCQWHLGFPINLRIRVHAFDKALQERKSSFDLTWSRANLSWGESTVSLIASCVRRLNVSVNQGLVSACIWRASLRFALPPVMYWMVIRTFRYP